VWAAPLDRAKEHRGKNNVIATYLTAELDGLALGTICGRALIAAADGVDMDVTFEKVRCPVRRKLEMLLPFPPRHTHRKCASELIALSEAAFIFSCRFRNSLPFLTTC
jgi:hypothetical protein